MSTETAVETGTNSRTLRFDENFERIERCANGHTHRGVYALEDVIMCECEHDSRDRTRLEGWGGEGCICGAMFWDDVVREGDTLAQESGSVAPKKETIA